MYWKLREIKKFTKKSEIDSIMGKPRFQISNRLVYYYGDGILIAYSSRCFKIEGIQRCEYGEEGLYATLVYHFSNVEMLKAHFKIDYFEADDIIEIKNDKIDEEIVYGMTFQEVHNNMSGKQSYTDYREGETYILENDKMKVQNLFIMYGQYTLFFYGKSKKNKISGFQYTLCD